MSQEDVWTLFLWGGGILYFTFGGLILFDTMLNALEPMSLDD